MESISNHKGDGEWKGGHLRINSNEPGGGSDSGKGDEVELQERTPSRNEASDDGGGRRRRRLQFPRLGLDALVHESRPSDNGGADGALLFYKVYKRRWFGLVQLTLLNILVSWEVSVCRLPIRSLFTHCSHQNPVRVGWEGGLHLGALHASGHYRFDRSIG